MLGSINLEHVRDRLGESINFIIMFWSLSLEFQSLMLFILSVFLYPL